MVNPSRVNPKNFQVVEVLYDLNGFSVAWGRYEHGDIQLAMRWNGEDGDEDIGYPNAFGNPMWFMLPPELSLAMGAIAKQYSATFPIREDTSHR
jgi:hypothetical protein